MGKTVTAAVISLNEESNIRDCLACLSWADELLVIDAYSSDATAALAREAGARVILHTFDSYASQRNYAIEHAQSDWVLFVDADERVEQALAQEIQQRISSDIATPEEPVGYWVSRRNLILGHWVHHGGWWPDHQMRLVLRGRARYSERIDPHEVVDVTGPIGYLSNTLLHYNYSSLGQLVAKQRSYAQREARTLARESVQALPHRYLTQPVREFYRRYIQLAGYRDGLLGLLLALVMGWYRYMVYVNLRKLGRIDPPRQQG